MNRIVLTCSLFFAATLARAQFVPPLPPIGTPGIIDAWLGSDAVPGGMWDIGVNERVRWEDREGGGLTHAGSNYDFDLAPPTTNDNQYWISRLMPRVGFYDGQWSFVVEARQSYSWNDDRYTATAAGKNLPDDDGPIQLQQAYIRYGDGKTSPVTVTLGRQELTYGDQRLVGSAMWLNVPHSFDAARVRYQASDFGVEAFTGGLVYSRESDFNESNSNDRLSGLYADSSKLLTGSTVEAYVFARDVSRSSVNDGWSLTPAPFRFPAPQDLYTLGLHAKSRPGQFGPWDYNVEGMWQLGNRTAVFPGTAVAAAKAAPRLTQDAWAFVVQGGYTFKDSPGNERVALIIAEASGTHSNPGQTSQTFQNLLPSNHGLYGVMDFSSLQNIRDLRLNWTAHPTKAFSLDIDLHQQYLENTADYWYNAAGVPRITPGAAAGSGKGFGANPTYSSNLGQEADAIAGWKVTRYLGLEAGAGHFFRGDYVKESFRLVGSRDSTYAYVQATLNL